MLAFPNDVFDKSSQNTQELLQNHPITCSSVDCNETFPWYATGFHLAFNCPTAVGFCLNSNTYSCRTELANQDPVIQKSMMMQHLGQDCFEQILIRRGPGHSYR